ncbi:polysaccharide deacetylase family protein [Clostridium sp.]|uniref:polysaccharide deacetylase family protein n=1 Tax=Clostridium sp. TaxID=1506 RepID=UPI00258DA32A|nr:polysaccharide deacetylase family protein [Clostridium sp.]MDF2504554.1 putative xylanase/chitin deacetylase [Clostridium sp.]
MKKLYKFTNIAFIFILFMCITNRSNVYGYESRSFNNSALKINRKLQYNKEVFLTFDDGPSPNNTRKILKILNDNNVKATFFIVGIKGKENPAIIKELSDDGMSIGIHTFSHDYKNIYKDLDSYILDYEKCKDSIIKSTGKNPIPYVRLPGGSDNLVANKLILDSIKTTLNYNGINYVDWNVCSGDADSQTVPVIKIKDNIQTQCKNKKMAVILMHDTYYKHFTVESLPEIITYLKNQGFVFRTFDDLTEEEEENMLNAGIMNRQ